MNIPPIPMTLENSKHSSFLPNIKKLSYVNKNYQLKTSLLKEILFKLWLYKSNNLLLIYYLY